MADISVEIKNFQEAEYGEEVRGSMISLAEKVNKESTDAKNAAQKAVSDTVEAGKNANTAAAAANTATTNANNARDAANTAASNANTKAQLADSKATLANTAASNADSKAQACQTATTAANTAATNANNKATAAQTAATAANTATTNANTARDAANTAATNANNKATAANTAATAANDAAERALAAAGGEISDKTVTYTESTAATAPASGSKLSLISGWLVGKVKNLVTRMGTAETSINQLNSNLLLVNTDAGDGSPFSKNFMLTGSATPGATPQRSAYFSKPADDTDWVNMPTALQGKLWVGYRQVYRRSSANILIRIIEMYPSDGRIWTNFYNNGTWKGWKSITPQ